jgi:hypothetical protein
MDANEQRIARSQGASAARDLLRRTLIAEERARVLEDRVGELTAVNETLAARRVALESECAACVCACHGPPSLTLDKRLNSAAENRHHYQARACGGASQQGSTAEPAAAAAAATTERFAALLRQLITLTKAQEEWTRREARLVETIDALTANRRDGGGVVA